MNEQRTNVEDPSRKAETLGEGVVRKALDPDDDLWGTMTLDKCDRDIAALIDTRFTPLIEAAEAVLRSGEVVTDSHGMYVLGVCVDAAAAMKAAIANAKGAK